MLIPKHSRREVVHSEFPEILRDFHQRGCVIGKEERIVDYIVKVFRVDKT